MRPRSMSRMIVDAKVTNQANWWKSNKKRKWLERAQTIKWKHLFHSKKENRKDQDREKERKKEGEKKVKPHQDVRCDRMWANHRFAWTFPWAPLKWCSWVYTRTITTTTKSLWKKRSQRISQMVFSNEINSHFELARVQVRCHELTLGKWYKYGANSSSTARMMPDDTKPAICVRPPTFSCKVERDNAAEHGNAAKKDANTFDEPSAINSWLASIGYLCFLANIFANESDTAKQTIASMQVSRKISLNRSTRGIVGCGSLWIR